MTSHYLYLQPTPKYLHLLIHKNKYRPRKAGYLTLVILKVLGEDRLFLEQPGILPPHNVSSLQPTLQTWKEAHTPDLRDCSSKPYKFHPVIHPLSLEQHPHTQSYLHVVLLKPVRAHWSYKTHPCEFYKSLHYENCPKILKFDD